MWVKRLGIGVTFDAPPVLLLSPPPSPSLSSASRSRLFFLLPVLCSWVCGAGFRVCGLGVWAGVRERGWREGEAGRGGEGGRERCEKEGG